MDISLVVNYELFVSILVIWWGFKAIMKIILGLTRTERPSIDSQFNSSDIIDGIVTLIVCILCINV